MHRYSVVCLAILLLVSSPFLLHAGQVAIVFSLSASGDSAHAAGIKAFLDSRGHPSTLVPLSAVASQDFAPFQLIIATNGSGWMSTWGDSVDVAAIKNANRAVLGIGEGGYALFGKLGLPIGYPYAAHASTNSLLIPNTLTDLFLVPNLIAVPSDHMLPVYNSPNALVEYFDRDRPSSTWLLARE